MKKMLIRTMVFTLLAMVAGGAGAQRLTELEAKERAGRFLKERRSQEPGVRSLEKRSGGLTLTAARVEARSIYAFNREGGGYVIVSADRRTLPVLGYSDEGRIDWESMPEQMRYWLRQYDEAIASLGDRQDFEDGVFRGYGGTEARGSEDTRALGYTRTSGSRAAVEPLIRTNWYQIVPYYNECPLYEGADTTKTGKRCLSGCVATSMAQVMNFYRWPEGVGDGLPGYDIETVYGDTKKTWHIDALPPTAFAWDDMLDWYLEPRDGSLTPKDTLGTEAEQLAVATLMRYCGQAIQTNYDPAGSASSVEAQYEALVRTFGYEAATLLTSRAFFGIDEWEDIIYGELAEGRPVLYCGYAEKEGHSFVCDGYDGDGLFHINWGWGGKDDGYYALSVLNPYNNTSAGAASSGIGFSISQGAIIYLDPTMAPRPDPMEGKPVLVQTAPIRLEDDHTVRFQFDYRGEDAGRVAVDNALGTRDGDGLVTPRFMGDLNDSIVYRANYMLVEIDSTAFEPGDSLRLYPLLRFRHGDNQEWQMIPPDDYCVDAGRTAEGRFFIHVRNNDDVRLTFLGGAVTKGTGAAGVRSDVTVTVGNSGEKDFIETLYLIPYYDNGDVGETMACGAYIRAGQEGEVTFSFRPRRSGKVRLELLTTWDQKLGEFELKIQEATDVRGVRSVECGVRKVESILLPKGVYIRNGKKYIGK